MYFKIATVVLALFIVWQLVTLGRVGRKLSREHKRLRRYDGHTLMLHRRAIALIGCATVLGVVLIEAQVRMSPNPYASGLLLMGFHLLMVAMLLATFVVLVFRVTGLYNPNWHWKLAYSFFALFALVVGTGSILLYRLPT